MPGLAGMVSENVLDEQLLNRMVISLKHEEFHRVDKYFSQHFACARIHLGIFNPEIQPIFNEDKSICIFMDGKIYDYKERLNELKKRGHKFNNENDPEFCLHSYEEYGKDFIKSLNGNFVLLIYDFKSAKVIIANDRFGLRVHYYAINDRKLLFAPEAKAILQDETFKKELNDEAVAEFLAFGELWDDKTFFKGIKVLTPASILTYDGRDVSIEKYWELKFEPDYNKSEDEFVNELVKTFKKAVDIRMKDNLRYGVSLSGGLDSRTILAGIPPETRKDVIAFTFGPKDCDEVKIAEIVEKKAEAKEHLVLDILPELIIDNAEKEVWLTDGRDYIGMSFAIPLFKSMKDKIDVYFDGFLLDTVIRSSILTENIVNAKSEKELFELVYSKVSKISEEELSKLFIDEYYNKIKKYPLSSFKEAFDKVKEHNPGNKSNLFRIRNHTAWARIGFTLTLPFVEHAIPASDNDFVDVIRTIPLELRLNHYIHRKFLMKLSPELAKIPYNKTMVRVDAPLLFWRIGKNYSLGKEFIKKKIYNVSKGMLFLPDKRSYVNFNEWFRTNEKWLEFFRELLLKEDGKAEKYLNKDYIEKLLQEQVAGEKNNSLKLLYIASFKVFLNLFF